MNPTTYAPEVIEVNKVLMQAACQTTRKAAKVYIDRADALILKYQIDMATGVVGKPKA